MEHERGFWRWLWRFNAVAIAGVAVIGGVLGLAGLYALAMELTGERHVGDLVNIEESAAASTSEQLGAFSRLGRTGLLWAPLRRETVSPLRAYSKHATAIADYVIYNPATGATRRLLDRDDALILDARLLHRPDDAEGRERAAAMLVRYVDADSNGDDRLNDQDLQRLAFAKPSGVDLTPLAEIERLLGVFALSERRAAAMIELEDGVYALHVDLATLSVSRLTSVTAETIESDGDLPPEDS